MTLEELRHHLVELRKHVGVQYMDQTIRTQVIALCFPATEDMNETERFLECMIELVEDSINPPDDSGAVVRAWEMGRQN